MQKTNVIMGSKQTWINDQNQQLSDPTDNNTLTPPDVDLSATEIVQ